jgi:Uri superfamily endonuclease
MAETNSGSYQIHIVITRNRKIKVGAIGEFLFTKGSYIYTGSAMKNLRQRIERHSRKEKKIRWHIDYLLKDKFVKIEKIMVYPSREKEECLRNMQLLNSGDYEIIVPHFGASDCKNCPAHLLKLKG